MTALHLELLVEEPSMEAFLHAVLLRLLPKDRTFQIHPFQGKADLLGKLEARLRGYAGWIPSDWRIVVVVDRDADDCRALKRKLEGMAGRAGLHTRTYAGPGEWQLVNRIAIEELEAWYFGDWKAVCEAFPRAPVAIPKRQPYRDPDAIKGGTWEAFERILQSHGYFGGGLPKIETARRSGTYVDPQRSTSRSSQVFGGAIAEAVRCAQAP